MVPARRDRGTPARSAAVLGRVVHSALHAAVRAVPLLSCPCEIDMTLGEFQSLIRRMYHDKDAARGVEGTFMWLTEEIGELATALRSGTHDEQTLEFADVLAWLATIANVAGVDLDEAVRRKYGGGCPGCGQLACTCPDAEKP